MKNTRDTGIAKLVLTASMAAVLAACGGGGGSSSASSPSAGATSATAASTMSGTVAIGDALANATVTVIDSTGKTASTTSGSNGAYSVSITGLTAPFVITASDPSGASGTLYSVVANATTTGGAAVTANVTPLTTAVAALLTPSGNPLTLTQAGALSSVTPATTTAAVTVLDNALSQILTANGLSPTSFDPIGGAFTPNQNGADAVIDSVQVTPSASGSGLQLTSLAAPNTSIQLNQNTTTTTALPVPAQTANYLASLVTSLGQCIAGTTSACSSAIDASYLNDGYSTMQARHGGLFASGTTLTGVKTVAMLPAGTLSAISRPAALVYFLYTSANGTQNFASDVVQQLPNGSWDIIGNQSQYNLYVASVLGQKQFTDSADAANGRLESGLKIEVTPSVTVNGTSTEVGSALVQGAGLPSKGLYLLNEFNGDLVIPTTALTGPYVPTPCTVVNGTTVCGSNIQLDSTSNEYVWDWASLTGGASSYSPNGATAYAPQPLAVSGIPQYSVYTITLYDESGNQIGQPQQVLNIAANVTAASGAAVAWQTLGSDVVSNFLTSGGSETTAALTSLNVDWTVPTAIQGTSLPNFGVTIGAVANPSTSVVANHGYYSTYSGAPTISGTTYSAALTAGTGSSIVSEALSSETKRFVKLGWQADGLYYSNQWVYK
jgi:hypothetical protein